MTKHTTQKTTPAARVMTLERRARRRDKYAPFPALAHVANRYARFPDGLTG